MSKLCSFAPIARPDACILILGSMPGGASLEAQQYYAHPRNLFWLFIAVILKAPSDLPYQARLQLLLDHKIALWDVLQECVREGSLDSAIKHEAPNDFVNFLNAHPHIHTVFFNGQKSRKSFKKYVLPSLDLIHHPLSFITLPSTSPANASQKYDMKLSKWHQIKEAFLQA